MERKSTLSLADDKRARVPFALVAVVLLTTSIISAGYIAERSAPEIDVSPDLVHERTTMAAESVIQNAVSDAIVEAGQQPVTDPSHTEVGAALGSDSADPDEVFHRYVKLRIYNKINDRLDDVEQTVSGQHGDADGHAQLPELANDEEQIEAALDRIDLEVGTGQNGLDRGEFHVSIDEVQHTVSTEGHQIHQEERSYTVTGETAVFEMHSQVMEYQQRLDDTVEPMLYARIYPKLTWKVMQENFMAPYIFQSNAFPQIIDPMELDVHTNDIRYDVQRSVFGTTDDGYPTVMNAANGCLAQLLGGQFATGVASRAIPMPYDIAPFGYPGDSLCYYIMYAEMDQASTTATTDIPDVQSFADNDTGWESQGDLFNHIPGAAEGAEDFELDPENLNEDDLSASERAAVSEHINQNSPGSNQEIEIDLFANQIYIEMFDKPADYFSEREENANRSAINSSLPENATTSNRSAAEGIESIDATQAQEDDVNDLRKQLIEDVDPVEATHIQLLSADDIFGEMVLQIEQNSDEYVYRNGSYPGPRNAYLQNVIDAIIAAEEGRQDAAEQLDDKLGNESLEEQLILAEAAIQGEADNPEVIEEIAENQTYESTRRADRLDLDGIERAPVVWWPVDREHASYASNRHSVGNEDEVGVEYPMSLDDVGIPENVTEQMLFEFEGDLPRHTDEVTSIRWGTPESSGWMHSRWANMSDPADDADWWNLRVVDGDRQIYRATNAEYTSEELHGRFGMRSYFQVHPIDEEKMNLTDGAESYVGDDVFVLTAFDIPEEEEESSVIDPEAEELAVPDLRPAEREDFQFDIQASPNYLSSLPITRDIEPAVRPAREGPTNPRNTLFTPMSAKVANYVPNPGIPIIPFPPSLWLASANYWQTDLKAEYARFELQSNTSTGLDVGPENYVRQDMVVEENIGGESIRVGSVEPISIEATNHFPMVAPGRVPSKKMASKVPAPKKRFPSIGGKLNKKFGITLGPGSWGAGNNLNMLSIGAPIVPEWTPEKCTAGWPEVGPGVDPIRLERDCADYGPIGQAIASPTVGAGALQASVLKHAAEQEGDDSHEEHLEELAGALESADGGQDTAEEINENLENRQEFDTTEEELERMRALCTKDEPCPGPQGMDRDD